MSNADGGARDGYGGRLVFVFDIGGGEPVNPSEPYDLSNASYTDTSVNGRSVSISISGIVVNDTSNVSKITVVCETQYVDVPPLSKDLQKDDPNGEYTLLSDRLNPSDGDGDYITSATIKVFDTSGVVIQEKQI